MKFLSTTMIAATAVALFATGLATQGQAQDAAAVVKQRIDIMKANGGAAARINKAEDAKAVVVDAKLIQAGLKQLDALWPANSMTAESRAKPEIWSDAAGFKAELVKIQAAADQVVAMAEKGDLQGSKDQMKAVAAVCGTCHQAYRGPAKQ